jgi:hypothetical protein
MRLIPTLSLALCVALPVPVTASEGSISIHKHRINTQQPDYGFFNPAATALAPLFATVPVVASPKAEDDRYDGLSRHKSDCNYGCIDN